MEGKSVLVGMEIPSPSDIELLRIATLGAVLRYILKDGELSASHFDGSISHLFPGPIHGEFSEIIRINPSDKTRTMNSLWCIFL